jgi:bifunctional non-homologous end joining protein LigD
VPLRFIRPCSPIRATTPPVGQAWLHEPKLDGYRLQIIKSERAVRLYSRNGHEWTTRLATVPDALQSLACRSAVIDAELCFLTGTGAPNFVGWLCDLASTTSSRSSHSTSCTATISISGHCRSTNASSD